MMGFYTLVSAVGMFFSFMLSLILLVYPRITKSHSIANYHLAFCFFCIGYVLMNAILSSTQLYMVFPHLAFTAHIAVYLFMPFMFFYVRTLTNGRSISIRDLHHFIPVLLYVADMGGKMFVGAEQKMLLLKEQARKLDLSLLMAEGSFLPLKFHLYLSSVLFLVYVVAKLSLLLRAYTTLGISFATENKAWIRWVTIYSFLEIVLITPVCVAIYLDNTNDSLDLWNKSSLLFSSLSVFSAIFLFLHPKAIYGLAGAVVSKDKGEEDRVEVPNVDGDVQSEYVDQAELERVEVLIREKVFNGNRFLSPKYDLQHFSVDTGVKVKVLSAYLNNKLQMSLSDLLNQMRVDYCCQLMVDPEYYSYTLETLSEMSGFRNRTTFVNSFKKFKSSSPSAYWKSVKLIRDVDEKVLDGVQE